jgi:CBS domain-containing protein
MSPLTPPAGTVREAMRLGLVRCPPDATLRTVARMLAGYSLHTVAVADDGHWALISARDVARAAWRDPDTTLARELHPGPAVTVAPDLPLARAAELMVRDGVTHLLVVDPATELPVAVLSTLDVISRAAPAAR